MSSSLVNAYAVLGVDRDAPLDEIKAAYKAMVLLNHPDKNRGQEGPDFQAAQNAWAVLRNAESRAAHDAALALRDGGVGLGAQSGVSAEDLRGAPSGGTVDVDSMAWDEEQQRLTESCRCGGELILTADDAEFKRVVLPCPQCSLVYHVVYPEGWTLFNDDE